MVLKKKTDGGEPPMTTAQALGRLLKSARDIMRKDKGLNGDLDRLPLLTWIMFLKFLDDLEQQREEEAQLGRKKFRAAIDQPYRWRDWAANPQGTTGDELLSFINQDETRLPNDTRGPGLFAYLRGLSSSNGDNRRDVIATVFRGVDNRMKSGYLLRDVINKVAAIHFTSSEELHTLGALYESMLREMRDAAGDSGEFYTPRPVVRLMVEVVAPQLGETILDPASGTGGFLVEAFNHLSPQVKTVSDRKRLQSESIFGCEPKSLPYLLGQMNLLLHGLDAPQIDPGNALRFKLSEIGEKDRVDVILTNPPFGGEEEKGIQGNFPEDRQTAETALLFLQLIMRRLKRGSTGVGKTARAAVIVPDGTLFNPGPAIRIRQELLSDFNLHTVIRLPVGVFAPYAKSIKTNILFFDRSGPTKKIWYYEHNPPSDRKTYSKTKPIQYDDLLPIVTWTRKKAPSDHAWCVKLSEISTRDYNLDFKNPAGFEELVHQPPASLVSKMNHDLQTTVKLVMDIEARLPSIKSFGSQLIPLGDIAELIKRPWYPTPGDMINSLGVRWWGKGAYIAETKAAEELQADRYEVRPGDLIYNDMWARHGSVAIVDGELSNCVASAHFPTWTLDLSKVYPPYLTWCFKSPWFWAECEERSRGSTGRNAIRKGLFRTIAIPLPSVEEQRQVSDYLQQHAQQVEEMKKFHSNVSTTMDALMPSLLDLSLRPQKS
jgi:type I restriction enzyme M protein